MEITRYLAMTAEEYSSAEPVPEKIAWMACHFSPYSTSLSNLPAELPPNSLLILNDSTPPDRQDPEIVAKVLENTVKLHNCSGLLLDFQRKDCPKTASVIRELLRLNFPVCVSEQYAKDLDCPVFLPPLPLTIPLSQYIAPWTGRQIWLDISLNGEEITVTENGALFSAAEITAQCPFGDKEIHCHYQVQIGDDAITFTLRRTREDLNDLLAEADALGIKAAIGLYQELK